MKSFIEDSWKIEIKNFCVFSLSEVIYQELKITQLLYFQKATYILFCILNFVVFFPLLIYLHYSFRHLSNLNLFIYYVFFRSWYNSLFDQNCVHFFFLFGWYIYVLLLLMHFEDFPAVLTWSGKLLVSFFLVFLL